MLTHTYYLGINATARRRGYVAGGAAWRQRCRSHRWLATIIALFEPNGAGPDLKTEGQTSQKNERLRLYENKEGSGTVRELP